jgi:Delta3-Delta2-enoyl-CoA isomerase
MLHLDFQDGIAELRMDRPPANGLNRELATAVLAGLAEAAALGARAIILTGRPGMFSGGLDVPEMLTLDRAGVLEFWQLFFGLNRALAANAVPVIAAISGHAPAGGAVLALHCDFRIAAAGNFKIGLNEVQVGLPVPVTILAALESVVGKRIARRLATRGELIPVAEAATLGLVDELAPPDQLAATARARAEELLALPPVAMNTPRLNCKADLLAALGRADDAVAATAWWFSPETQAGMRKLAARLQK